MRLFLWLWTALYLVNSSARPSGQGKCSEIGIASVYASRVVAAVGEHFDSRALTAAHRTLAFGTQVNVTNLNNGKSVTVKINDRGPFVHGRLIDLSPAAAAALGIRGLSEVGLNCVWPEGVPVLIQGSMGTCFLGPNCEGISLGMMYYETCKANTGPFLSWLGPNGLLCYN